MKKDKLYKIEVPILNEEYSVYVLWGSPEKARNWLAKYFGDKSLTVEDFAGWRGRTFYKRECMPVIWVSTHKYFWASLAHEAVHAIEYIWEYVGEKDVREIYAHSVGAVVRAVQDKRR